MNMSEMIALLREESEKFPYLVHARNLVTRFDRNDHLDVLEKVVEFYCKYYNANKIVGTDQTTIRKRVDALNEYYDFLFNNGFDNNRIYSAQTKFRPTILEEFMALLFRDLVSEVSCAQLNLGTVKAYANLYFYGKNFTSFVKHPMIGLNVKDQDFAIYRNVEIAMDGDSPICASLPVVAVECKTFIDKTMLEGSVATAEKLKVGNPYAYFCIVTELYDVSMNVDPAYSRLDEVYVLRKTTRRAPRQEIDADVVIKLVNDVKTHLGRPWSDVATKLVSTGTLIR